MKLFEVLTVPSTKITHTVFCLVTPCSWYLVPKFRRYLLLSFALFHTEDDTRPHVLEYLNPLNAELNSICHLLALLGAHHIFHVSGLRVNVEPIISYFNIRLVLSEYIVLCLYRTEHLPSQRHVLHRTLRTIDLLYIQCCLRPAVFTYCVYVIPSHLHVLISSVVLSTLNFSRHSVFIFLPMKLRPEGFQSSFLSQLLRNVVAAPFMVSVYRHILRNSATNRQNSGRFV